MSEEMPQKAPERGSSVELEMEMLDLWKKRGITQKLLEHNRGNEYFRFLEGPPTANARPGVHHVFARTIKDAVCRYKNMLGYYVPRMGGWDCHGLPVEIAVEKELGIDTKEQIEEYGIEPFIRKCRESVFTYIDDWSRMTERLAYILDLEDPYITMTDSYIESVWWSLKEIWKKGLLKEGHTIVPFCPRCGTSLSSHEVAQGYREVEEPSIFIKFKVISQENTYILAWTTTPWTLISNVSLAVNPDEFYLRIRHKEQELIFAEKRVAALMEEGSYEVLQRIMGSDLEGVRYEPLYDFVKPEKAAHFVTTADFVTMDDGTGVVHIAPAFGEDDYNLGKTYDLPMVQPVGSNGTFTDEVTPWKGMFVKDADPLIMEDLKKRGLLEGVHQYIHQYPFCWRCESPLLYYARKGVFISMSRLRKNLMDNNERITWYPSNIKKGRFGNFLEEVKDWNLSRERYWGTPLPLWKCPNGHEHMVGSIEELRSLSGLGEIPELHRPYVDEVHFACPECGSEMERVNYVIDCWYDSGSAFLSSLHYPFENRDEFEDQFPRDFIAEGIDQTRGWFYSLLAVSTAVFDRPSYLSVICHAHVLDSEGKKMSKSKGNVVDPWVIFDKEGADALRWYLLSVTAPWKPKLFSAEGVNEVNRSFLATVRNVLGFYRTYADLDGYEPGDRSDPGERPAVDRWLLSRLNSVVRDARSAMDDYDLLGATGALNRFIVDDLSNWYVRVNRRRFWGSEDSRDKRMAYDTLAEALYVSSLLMAPLVPYHSEKVFQEVGLPGEEDCVHLSPYPETEEGLIDTVLEGEMTALRKVVELGRAARGSGNMKIRQPLSRVVVKGARPFEKELWPLIMSELNVKGIIFESDLSGYFELTAEPDPKKIGPRFKAVSGIVTQALKEMDPRDLAEKARGLGIEVEAAGEKYTITGDELRFHEVLGDRYALGSEGDLEVIIDLQVTEELKLEGIAREVVRRVQTMRKDADLEYDARIDLVLSGSESVIRGVREWRDYIMQETLADSLEIGEVKDGKEWKLDDGRLLVYLGS